MSFKTGAWGEQAKLRSQRRKQYFIEYRRTHSSLSPRRRRSGLEVAEKKDIRGENNPNWKGDRVGYVGLHSWIKDHFPKPDTCQQCHLATPYDLANISQEYKRDVSDWEWLCRRCHIHKDGRIEILRRFRRHANSRREEVSKVS